MRKLLFAILSVAVLSITATAQKPKIVTTAQVNGIYRDVDNEFRIIALGHNKLKVRFEGVYPTLAGGQHLGGAIGEATIEGNIATFFPEQGQACKITMSFLPGKLVVNQIGQDFACGFGANVNAAGTYRKIRGGKPKLESLSVERKATASFCRSSKHRAGNFYLRAAA